jgi:hypothetical protein
VCQGRNWRYRELLESHHQPGDERGEGAYSGEPRRASGDLPAGVHYPHDDDFHGYYDANHRHNYCHDGYYGYHGYNHRHNYCHHRRDGCATSRDDHHHRRYHIAAGNYYCAEHHGVADQPLPVSRLPAASASAASTSTATSFEHTGGCVEVPRALSLELLEHPRRFYVNVTNEQYPEGA